jgi:hypothetical protein
VRGTLILLISGALALLAPAGASAAVQCGDVIDHDVKLKADLDCSSLAGDALEIGANGVTIDLNGHKLIGPDGVNNGISDSTGYNRITVTGGTIKGFYHAIDFVENEDVTLSHLKINLLEDNDNYGPYLGDQRHVRISHVVVRNALYGFYIYRGKDVKIRHSRIVESDPTQTHGIDIGNNSGRHSGVIDDVQADGAQYAFYIYGSTKSFKVSDSRANDSGYAGFYFANDTDNEPRDYVANHNTANDGASYGFYAAERVPGVGNHATGNAVRDCRKVACEG